jgi:Uma2 family endonuclease
MSTLEDIQRALERLSIGDREILATWLRESAEAGYRIEEPRSGYAVFQPQYLSVAEYLEFEARSAVRHEYIGGVIHAMSGVSLAHNRISLKLANAFSNHVRGGPCEVFMSDVKVNLKIDTDEIFYYPDIMVACERDGWGRNCIHNPKLVVEVLSASTEHIDRREKSAQLPSGSLGRRIRAGRAG